MDISTLRKSKTNVDLEKVAPLNQKRTIAFFNHWAINTVDFINKFSGICETKLNELDVKLQRSEDALSILEAKLSSIPGLEEITAPTIPSTQSETTPPPSQQSNQSQAPIAPPPPPPPSNDASLPPQSTEASLPPDSSTVSTEEPVVSFTPISKDPRYMTFFKMVAVGVPPPAVKIKMSAQGLDPSLLDNPDAPAPEGGSPLSASESDDGEVSSWSD